MLTSAGNHANFDGWVDMLATPAGYKVAYPWLDKAGPSAMVAILRGLEQPDWRVRRWCAALLDHHGNDRALEGLSRALNDPVAAVRRLALHAIGCQACKATPLQFDLIGPLHQRALRDPSIRVRRAAAHMLGNQPPDPRATEALGATLSEERDAKLQGIGRWALARQRRNYIPETAP